ncbi:MAG: DoxX family protein [Candidatus Pacebacteria bacterium]|nr:DoxX family protein [Candidatus Paceibacterota bacterium]MBP9780486.1 DoxX family protein [Candidatus Paceibacterota bacterium]MDQ5950007.1 putative oxidoreductase [Patescibacteria group bacterium]
MKKCSWMNSDTGILVLRIGVAGIFIMSGWLKVSNLSETVGFFASTGIGAFWAYAATFGELIGGLLVLLGIFTRLGALLLAIIMAVAISLTYKDITLVMTPFILFVANLSLILSGGGRFSLIRKICGCGKCMVCKSSDVEEKSAPQHTQQ